PPSTPPHLLSLPTRRSSDLRGAGALVRAPLLSGKHAGRAAPTGELSRVALSRRWRAGAAACPHVGDRDQPRLLPGRRRGDSQGSAGNPAMTINLSGLGIDYGAILPELIVVGTAIVVIFLDLAVPADRRGWLAG